LQEQRKYLDDVENFTTALLESISKTAVASAPGAHLLKTPGQGVGSSDALSNVAYKR
jgi:hypothetical protein